MTIRCWKVEKKDESTAATFGEIPSQELGEVLATRSDSKEPTVRIRVLFSSLNYKDGLALNGHPGVAKSLPLIPGIDAAGEVIESESDSVAVGDKVLVFHAKFGTLLYGAYSEEIVVPESWVYACPSTLSLRDSMIIGTAGFTAAQCLEELQRHDITPDQGEIVVSGATGGVGVFAVKFLSSQGYRVVASTGKLEQAGWLKEQGAESVIDRESLVDTSGRPLLKSRWAGAVDTVGGDTLASIIRGTKGFGCVTACGLVGGTELVTTVYPYILRGVTLQGIDTANISRERRMSIWQKISTTWKLDHLDQIASEVPLSELASAAKQIMGGQIKGRVVVKVSET